MWILARIAALCGVLAAAAAEASLFLYVSKVLAIIVGFCAFVAVMRLLDAGAVGGYGSAMVFLLVVAILVLAPCVAYNSVLVRRGVEVEVTVVSDWYLNQGTGDEAAGQRNTIQVRQCVVRLPDGRVHPKRINDCHTAVGDRMRLLIDPDLELVPSDRRKSQLSDGSWIVLALAGLLAVTLVLAKHAEPATARDGEVSLGWD